MTNHIYRNIGSTDFRVMSSSLKKRKKEKNIKRVTTLSNIAKHCLQIREAIKVEKKKCDKCHTFGFDPPPPPRV